MSVKDWVKKSVGFKSHVTICDAKPIIGWGRNLYDVGISKSEADYLFENDFNSIKNELSEYPFYISTSQNIQDGLLNMAFHMGMKNLLTFKQMLNAILIKDYKLAALELLNSSWAKKNEKLAKDIAVIISENKDDSGTRTNRTHQCC